MIKNTKGEVYVLVCVFMLIIITTFSVVLTFSSVVTMINLQKENTEVVFDSFIAKNSIVIFNNIKQGKNAIDGVDSDEFYTSLKTFCTLDEQNGKLYSIDENGDEKYKMTIPQIGFTSEGHLELFVTYIQYVPIKFGGVTVATARVPIKITSALQSKINGG